MQVSVGFGFCLSRRTLNESLHTKNVFFFLPCLRLLQLNSLKLLSAAEKLKNSSTWKNVQRHGDEQNVWKCKKKKKKVLQDVKMRSYIQIQIFTFRAYFTLVIFFFIFYSYLHFQAALIYFFIESVKLMHSSFCFVVNYI